MSVLVWAMMGLLAGGIFLLGEVFVEKKEITLAYLFFITIVGAFSGAIGLLIMILVIVAIAGVYVLVAAENVVVINKHKQKRENEND